MIFETYLVSIKMWIFYKKKIIRFKEKDVRPMGRGASGVRGMRLKSSDEVIGIDIFNPTNKNLQFLTVGANGLGKRTPLDEYKTQGRGGSGIKTTNITDKTGPLLHARVIDKEEIAQIHEIAKGLQARMNERH